MGYQDFIQRLNPKVANALKTAETNVITRLPLASIGLTEALGGGIAKGRICLVYGSPSAGKTLLLLQSIAMWQADGLVCAWVDAESAFDKEWAKKIGVNVDELILIQSKSSGRVEEEIRPLLEAEIDVIVVDSISDILPEVFIGKSGEMNSQEDRKQIGSHAKAITALINGIHYLNKDTAVVLISQTTTQMNQTYVEQVPHGGQKAMFAASQAIRLTSSASPNAQIPGHVERDGQIFNIPVAREVEALVKKNKLGSPFQTCKYNLHYAGDFLGIDRVKEVLDEAIAYGVVTKAGAWFKYTNGRQWQGNLTLAREMRDNQELFDEISNDLKMAKSGGEVVV